MKYIQKFLISATPHPDMVGHLVIEGGAGLADNIRTVFLDTPCPQEL
jgi:hypothetical protein